MTAHLRLGLARARDDELIILGSHFMSFPLPLPEFLIDFWSKRILYKYSLTDVRVFLLLFPRGADNQSCLGATSTTPSLCDGTKVPKVIYPLFASIMESMAWERGTEREGVGLKER